MSDARPTVDRATGQPEPFFTVLLASHNRLDYLKRALESASCQEHDSFEILVVDDGSSAETKSWLEETERRNPLMRVVFQEHSGVTIARQEGLLQANGEWICVLDSDDLLVPGALRELSNVILTRADVDLVYGSIVNMDHNGKAGRVIDYPVYDDNRKMIRCIFLRPQVPFKHSGTAFHRATALSLGGYDTSLPLKLDVDLFLKYLVAGKSLHCLCKPLVMFRQHRRSISNSKRLEGIRIWWQLIEKYGPSNRFANFCYKVVRGGVESAKYVYAEILYG